MLYRRFLLVSGFSFVVASSFALDFQSSGETLEKLFPKLSQETGLTLTVNGDIKNEVLIINANGVEPIVLLKKIGDATGLIWIQEEGGYRLARNFEVDQKANLEYAKFTRDSWLEYQANPTKSQPSPVDDIAAIFPPDYLANITIGGRVVFADRNNRNQTAMPTNVRDLATAIVKEQSSQRIAAMQTIYDRRPNDGLKAMIDTFKAPLSKVILVVRRNSLTSWSFTLQGLDQSGNDRFSFGSSYGLTNPAGSDAGVLSAWKLAENSSATENLKLLSGSTEITNSSDQSLLRKFALDPANNEPFSLAIGPALLESAPKGQNFVACIPDESFDRVTTALLFQGPAGLSGTGVRIDKDQDGWVIISPTIKVHNWDTRRDRAAIKPVMNKLATAGILSINDQADYAKTVSTWYSTNSWEFNLARRSLGAAVSRELGRMTGSQIEGLAIYNALRSKMTMQSESKPLQDLARNFVTFTVFNSPSDPRGAPQQVAVQGRNNTGQPQQTMEIRRGQNSERTEMYVGGLPMEGKIDIRIRTEDAYVVRSLDNRSQSVMDEGDLTTFRASQLSTNIRNRGGELSATNNNFGKTRTTRISFDITFADGTSFSRSISGTDAPSTFVEYGRLPAQTLQKIEQQAQAMASRANERGNNNGRRGGRGNPPPPTP